MLEPFWSREKCFIKPLVATIILALLSLRASAEPLGTYVENAQNSIYTSLGQGGGEVPFVYLPYFDQSLGTLQAVQLGLSFNIYASFSDQLEGLTVPATATVTFGLGLYSAEDFGFPSIAKTVVPAVGGGAVYAGASASFDQQFLATKPSDYESNCNNNFYCDNNSFYISASADLSFGNAYIQDYETISYDLSEAFYYAPITNVPEPASAGLLFVGCIGSIAFAKYRRRAI